MLLKSITTSIAVFLTGFFGCSKPATPASTTSAPPPAVESKIKDLGVVPMTNDSETCVSFGSGKDCRIIPKLLDRDNIQLTMTMESKDTKGHTAGLSVVRVVGNSRKPFQVSVGGTDFTFTPQIVAE